MMVVYAVSIIVRLLMTPFILIFCTYQWLRAIFHEEKLIIQVRNHDGDSSKPKDGLGVTDTAGANRVKQGGSF